jgi:glycerol-3-phosphate dehydrogenase (NAD(P)+)
VDRVAVLGGGSWGTCLAHLAGQAGPEDVVLWMRDEGAVREVNEQRTNRRYLGEVRLAERVRATTDLREAVLGTRLVIVAVPSSAFRDVSAAAGEFVTGDQVLLSATKGLEPRTFARMSQVLAEETCARKVGAVSGPNLAKEIIAGQPAATVVASRFREAIVVGARLLHGPALRVYGNMDLKGVELAGALKNVIAIATGVAQGLGFGTNVRAMIITRGLAEVQRLGVKLGADPLTFSGLAGIGDLMATCSSELSRNFRVGLGLARGRSLDEITAELGEVAEGVNTTRVALALARSVDVALPITEGVGRLLDGGETPRQVLDDLMTRAARYEIDFDYTAEVVG